MLLLLLLVIAAGGYLGDAYPLLRQAPWDQKTRLNAPVAVAVDGQQDTYIVDDSMMRILKVDAQGRVVWRAYGGSRGQAFYRCRDLTVDEHGQVYVLNQVYGADGRTIMKESIEKFSPAGTFLKTVVSYSYAEEAQKPELYGWILSLRCIGNELYYAYAKKDSIELCRATGTAPELLYSTSLSEARSAVMACVLGYDQKSLYYISKRGAVVEDRAEGLRLLYRGHGSNRDGQELFVPCALDTDQAGRVYLADSASGEIRRVEGDGTLSLVLPAVRALLPQAANPPGYEYVCAGADGTMAAAVNTEVLSTARGGQLQSTGVFQNGLSLQLRIWLAWAAAAYLGICLLFLLLALGHKLWQVGLSQSTQAILAAFAMAVLVLGVVGGVMLSRQYALLNRQISGQIYSLLVTAANDIDVGALGRYQSYSDYGNADFRRLQENIEALRKSVYEGKSSMFFVLYKTDGQRIFQVLDSPDTDAPLSIKFGQYQGSVFERAAQSGSIQMMENIWTSIGVWTSGVVPIYNADHSLAGFAEIGINAKAIYDGQTEKMIELVLLVIGGTIAMLIIFSELVHFLAALRRERSREPAAAAARIVSIVRPMAFALLFADFMQNAFAPIYVNRMEDTLLDLPPGIVVACAMGVQVVATSLFAIWGGRLQGRLGLRRELLGGGFLAAAGFLLCGWQPLLLTYLCGKAVIGAGLGFVHVAFNTMLSELPGRTAEDGFSSFYAGFFAAINVGSVAGGFLATFLGYELTYILAGGLMLAACLLAAFLYRREDVLVSSVDEAEQVQKSSTWEFFSDRRVFSFFGALYVPYLIMSYFVYYFFPLFAFENGWEEAWIGQVLMLNGLAVVYFGPTITRYLLQHFSDGEAAVLGSVMNLLALGLFVAEPSMAGAVLVLLVMGCADSFVYSAQECYFVSLPVVRSYGLAPANGLKNAIENAAYTAAPFAFGAALLLGAAQGIAVITGSAAALLALFSVQLEPLRERWSFSKWHRQKK